MINWAILTPLLVALLGGVLAMWKSIMERAQERVATNRAIFSEVSRLIAVIRRHHRWWIERVEKGDLLAPLIPFTTNVYDKLTDKLGQLDPRYVAVVVNFYGFVHFLNAIQKTRQEHTAEALQKFATFYSGELESVPQAFAPLLEPAFAHYDILAPELQPIVGDARRADSRPRPSGSLQTA